MIGTEEIKQLILNEMPGAVVDVSDMTGTSDHFEIAVTSPVFQGKSLIEQHKMIFDILRKEMDDRIHAVKLKTRAS